MSTVVAPLHLRVLAVIGSPNRIAVAYAADPAGTECAVSILPELAMILRTELRSGRQPWIDAELWQILIGFPRPVALR
jgi:hypothetical protein